MIHERKPNRMNGYDYSKDNLYFVTTCVHDRVCCFGEIMGTGRDLSNNENNEPDVGTGRDLSMIKNDNPLTTGTGRDPSVQKQMILNDYGQIAETQWHWLAEQYPYIVLHAFVVMPNHVHGIIEINRAVVGTGRDLSINGNHDSLSTGTGRDLSLPSKIKSLSELMGAYKTTVSKQIHLLGYPDFAWQRSFHDHIIRDDQSFNNISDYILNNPQKWEEDKFYRQ